uniref:Uncharacterized protein n=1 Tax=Solanum lycopersicum TaxID=4081 RepID=A0A3Q7H858_SOLLC
MNRAKKMKENTNLAPLPTEPPPDPLDKFPSYMDMLRDQILIPNSTEDLHMPSLNTLDATVTVSKGAINLTEDGTTVITLFDEDKQRMYAPWEFSIIVKLLGKESSIST